MVLKTFWDTCKQYRWKIISRFLKAGGRRFGIISESFYLLKLDSSQFVSAFNISATKIVEIKNIDSYDLSVFKFPNKKIELFRNRIDSGAYSCYGYMRDDQIVYITWVSWKTMNYPSFFGIVENLDETQALLEDSYCLPDYRGRGIHSEMNKYRLREVFSRAKKEVFVLILKENAPAIKAQIKCGFKVDSVIIFRKIFNNKRIIKKAYGNPRRSSLF